MLLGPHVLVPHRSGRDMQVNLLFCPEITAIISTEFIHSSLTEQVQCSESVLRPELPVLNPNLVLRCLGSGLCSPPIRMFQ